MAIFYTTLITETSAQLADPNNDFCTIPEVANWIKHYVKEFARLTRICKDTDTYSWAADTDEVALSSVIDITLYGKAVLAPIIYKAEWTYNTTSGASLLKVSKDEAWFLDPTRHANAVTGVPNRLYYDPYQDKVGLYPTPSTAGTLKVYFSYTPPDYSNSSTDAIPVVMEPYYVSICAGAAAQGKMKDKERYSNTNVQQSLRQYRDAISQAKYEIAKNTMLGKVGFVRDYPKWR